MRSKPTHGSKLSELIDGARDIPESPPLSNSHRMALPPLLSPGERPKSARPNAQPMSDGSEADEKVTVAGNIIVARMHIRAGLSAVHDAIDGYARDGIILPSGLTASLELRECVPLRNANRAVWCVGSSAIVAEHRSETLTELKMLAVRRIIQDDGTAHREWRLLESEFKKAGLWQKSEAIWDDGVAGIGDVLDERELIEGAYPELGDERQYKDRWRASFQADPVINKGLPTQRKLTPEQIESEVEQLWEIHCHHVEENQHRWHEIHRFQGMTTEQATLAYFATPTEQTRQSVLRQILSALRTRVHLGFLSLALILWLIVIAYSVMIYPTWTGSPESIPILAGLTLIGVVSFLASLRRLLEPSPR